MDKNTETRLLKTCRDLESDVEMLLLVLEATLVAIYPEKGMTVVAELEAQAREAKQLLTSAPDGVQSGGRLKEAAAKEAEAFERAAGFVRVAGKGWRKQ